MKRFFALKIFAFALALASFAAFANPEVKKLVVEYQKALANQQKERVQELTTEEYFKTLSKNNLLERLFKATENAKPPKAGDEYEVEVVESKVVKGSIMASVQKAGGDGKAEKDGHKDWYRIKKVGDKYLIDRQVHLD